MQGIRQVNLDFVSSVLNQVNLYVLKFNVVLLQKTSCQDTKKTFSTKLLMQKRKRNIQNTHVHLFLVFNASVLFFSANAVFDIIRLKSRRIIFKDDCCKNSV